MNPINTNDTASQKAVPVEEPRHIMTTTKEVKEEVTELVPVTEHNKKYAEHVKMVVSAEASGKEHRTAPAHTNPYDITTSNNDSHQHKRHRRPESSSW